MEGHSFTSSELLAGRRAQVFSIQIERGETVEVRAVGEHVRVAQFVEDRQSGMAV